MIIFTYHFRYSIERSKIETRDLCEIERQVNRSSKKQKWEAKRKAQGIPETQVDRVEADRGWQKKRFYLFNVSKSMHFRRTMFKNLRSDDPSNRNRIILLRTIWLYTLSWSYCRVLVKISRIVKIQINQN